MTQKKITLRDYQRWALDKLYEWFAENPEGNPIVSACVGAGKSILIAALCREAVEWDSRNKSRILVIAPSKELAEQNLEKLVELCPDLGIGVLSASLGRKQYSHRDDVVIGTPGTIVKVAEKLGFFDLVLCDESHLINPKDTGMYREIIRKLKTNNHYLRVVGWTGTAFRGNGIWLTEGGEALFTDIAASVGMKELLKKGFLAPLVIGATATQVSGDGLRTASGDYVVSELAQRLDRDELTEKIVGEIMEQGRDRKKWLVFCVTVAHAEHMAAEFKRRGIASAVVSEKTPKSEREAIVKGFKLGRVKALCNVACLTTGFDVPDLDLIALVRNTKSPVLYVQIAGRGMRIAGKDIEESIRNGKADCLWLDFTDTTALLGPVDDIRGRPAPRKKDGENHGTPFKPCAECGAINPAGATRCKTCGTAFPPPAPTLNTVASQATILTATGPRLETFPVDGIGYQSPISNKTGKPYLQILFQSDLSYFRINLFLEHEGYARDKSIRQWKELTTPPTEPRDVVDAVQKIQRGEVRFKDVESIAVDMVSKWKDITQVNYRREAEAA
ncbi:ATP-dependent helicase IRC3 [Methylomagnum ishizawai]|uniref:ATP-dependent helicase IRC3 n=1 Tax=Methylomagnum ishizawai TaxID=1760988 RepID=A0A1Y6CU69_9GAMM|nr:DEAD/DEAH box helicase [Methylomagnum ishizawai]SMF93971.1 ATP-dependent helicase IRC3 [Methylomagnum ishizawai]